MRHARSPASPRHRAPPAHHDSLASTSRLSAAAARSCTFGRSGPAFTRIRSRSRSHENCKTSRAIQRAGLRRNSRRRAHLPAFDEGFVELVRYLHSREPCRDTPPRSSPWAHWPRCPPDGWPLHRNRRGRRPRPAAARASDPQLGPPTISRPSVPLRFEPLPAADNGTRVFVARSAGYAVHVGPTWAEVHATARPGATAAPAADPIAMRFAGAAAGPREVSLEGAATTVNYLVGADRARLADRARGARPRPLPRRLSRASTSPTTAPTARSNTTSCSSPGADPAAGAARSSPAPAASRSAPTAISSSGRPPRRCASGRRSPTSSKARPASPCQPLRAARRRHRRASRSAASIAARRWSSIRSSATRGCSAAPASTKPRRSPSTRPATSTSPARRRRPAFPGRPGRPAASTCS